MRGTLLRANLQPLKYILQEQPKENEAPQVSGSKPWHAQVRLWRWNGERKLKKHIKLGRSSVTSKKIKRNSLFIEGTAAAGGGAIFKEGPCEFLVQIVRHWPTDSLPCQDEDHQHGILTVVPWPLADQAQQLLLFAATPDHLLDDTESKQVLKDDQQQCNAGKGRNKYFITVSRNYKPYWVMFATL